MMTSTRVALTWRFDQLAWEVRRAARSYTRRFGWLGWAWLLGVAVIVVAWIVERQQASELLATQVGLSAQQRLPIRSVDSRGADGRQRLNAFEDYLPGQEEISSVVQNLLKLADKEQLSLKRGEYRPQIDTSGRFMRFRMLLPVVGDARAIHRFMLAALSAQKTLALESVQFKRQRIESQEVEARIQWVLLVRLPASGADTMTAADALAGDAR